MEKLKKNLLKPNWENKKTASYFSIETASLNFLKALHIKIDILRQKQYQIWYCL